MKIVNYLDVTFNLNDGTYRPFRKPDGKTSYIHAESDHPPAILKHLPVSVEKRISDLSSSEKIFNESKGFDENALKQSGFNYELKYNGSVKSTKNIPGRRRKIIWFNPPYSKIVSTNIGKKFLQLITFHFPTHHKFYKIFNRNTIKISYCCMPNFGATINRHNNKILNEGNELNRGKCNCRDKTNCPLNKECLSENVLYEAVISCDLPNYSSKVYRGITASKFKLRYANHKKSFTCKKYSNNTELSKEFWLIKNKGANAKLEWKILKQCPSYNPTSNRCTLCLSEKLSILEYRGDNMLNKRSEIISTCRHRSKFLLKSID